MVLYTDENSNYHTGYPMAMRSFSQVLENNVLRGPYSFDEATHTQMEFAFDLVLDAGTGSQVRGPGGGRHDGAADGGGSAEGYMLFLKLLVYSRH